MKVFNRSQMQGYLKSLAMAVTACASLLLTACPSGGGGGGTVAAVPPPVYPTCAGCPGVGGSGQFLAAAVGDYGSNPQAPSVELDLQFYGIANGGAYGTGYSGQVAAAGRMIVTYPYANCGLVPGTYTLQSTQAAPAGGYEVDYLNMIATGPTQVQITVPQAFLDPSAGTTMGMDGQAYPYRFVNYSPNAPILMQAAGAPGVCSMTFY